MQKTQLDTD